MTRYVVPVGLVLSMAAAGISCGDSASPVQPAPVVPAAPSSPSISALRIEGQLELAAAGETTQLAAIGSYSDGTETTITEPVLWVSDDVTTVRVAPDGVLTAVDLGRAAISATYASRRTTVQVTVTPPGSFVTTGRVREPGAGNLVGVRLVELASGVSRMSRAGGDINYTIGGLTTGHLRFSREGYEDADLRATPGAAGDVPMQKVIRWPAGASVTAMVAAHDVNYEVGPGERCYPCKRLRLTAPTAGTVDLRLTWSEPRAELRLWADGQVFSAVLDLPRVVTATIPVIEGEQIIHVGGLVPTVSYSANHVEFTLWASAVR